MGRLQMSKNFAFLIPNNPLIKTHFYIHHEDLKGAKDGDLVLIGKIDFHESLKNPTAKVIEIYSGISANDIAMKEILLENDFHLDFPKPVYKELNALQEDFSQIEGRKDLRNILTFTIDPHDAKDFDDAISLEHLNNGNTIIGVHIADVSHYVQEGSALDKEAYLRATSVYLPDRVCPMLPEKISNELCSLRPHEDKMTFSVLFTFEPTGRIAKTWMGKTVTHSDRRFTYEEAQEIIEGKNGDHQEQLRWLNSLTQKIRSERMANGAINFSSQEVRFKLDEEARPIGIQIKTSKEANQLIEELMLLANKAVAAHVQERFQDKLPFPYRIHDAPDEAKLASFVKLASSKGYKFNYNDIPTSFNLMLKNAEGKPEKNMLETIGIRCMSKAVYSTKNIGHYGLAFINYCHFTSPIRRYPDVLVHRVLYGILQGNVKPKKDMEIWCKHCSDRERAAMDAERASNKYKQVEYMRGYIGQEFNGIISGVAHFGFWVETIDHKCEGLVSLQNILHIDEFRFEPSQYCLVGVRTKRKFAIGDAVRILVAGANLDTREIDYEIVT
jgi:ribonuclease R